MKHSWRPERILAVWSSHGEKSSGISLQRCIILSSLRDAFLFPSMLLRQREAEKSRALTWDPPWLFRAPSWNCKLGLQGHRKKEQNGHCLWHKATSQNVFKEKNGRWELGEADRNLPEKLFKACTWQMGHKFAIRHCSPGAAREPGSFPDVDDWA